MGGMFPDLEERPSDSPLVERVWRSNSERAGTFTSISKVCWSLVVSTLQGRVAVSLHGPETGVAAERFPPELEWFGIDFKLGAFLPNIPPGLLRQGCVTLPDAVGRSFWLNGSALQFPNYENADTFVDRLVREGLLTRDSIADDLDEKPTLPLSVRAVQYRFLHSTGLSQRTARQIQRAHDAATLLKQGVSILDTVFETGYSDQPHLTRSLKQYIGRTPSEIRTAPIVGLRPSSSIA